MGMGLNNYWFHSKPQSIITYDDNLDIRCSVVVTVVYFILDIKELHRTSYSNNLFQKSVL